MQKSRTLPRPGRSVTIGKIIAIERKPIANVFDTYIISDELELYMKNGLSIETIEVMKLQSKYPDSYDAPSIFMNPDIWSMDIVYSWFKPEPKCSRGVDNTIRKQLYLA